MMILKRKKQYRVQTKKKNQLNITLTKTKKPSEKKNMILSMKMKLNRYSKKMQADHHYLQDHHSDHNPLDQAQETDR